MSTDKTLADVQPGGRVRLGDQEFAQGCDELRMRTDAERSAYLEGVAEGRRAALSAQPSPGGQGDVCIPLPTPGNGEWSDGWNACREAMLRGEGEALAARQPVGQIVGYMDPNADFMLARPGDCVLMGNIVLWREPGSKYTKPLYDAPPAQAVDLGSIRDAVQGITLGFDGDLPYIKGIAEALTLIDSQAVGK